MKVRNRPEKRSLKLPRRSSCSATVPTGTPQRWAASTISCWSTKSTPSRPAAACPTSRAPLAMLPDIVTTGIFSSQFSPFLTTFRRICPFPRFEYTAGLTHVKRPRDRLLVVLVWRSPAPERSGQAEVDSYRIAVLRNVLAPVGQRLPIHDDVNGTRRRAVARRAVD